MKKIIFLDIDGVLNSHAWWDKFNELKLHEEEGYDFDLDPEAIMRLNKILMLVPEVKIVITSTWRFDYKDTVERLQAQGLIIPIIGCTTTSTLYHEGTYMPRGVLVKKWLNENTAGTTCNYVILDDDIDFLIEQRWNFIHTNIEIGLTDDDVQRTIAILGTNLFKGSKVVKSFNEEKQKLL